MRDCIHKNAGPSCEIPDKLPIDRLKMTDGIGYDSPISCFPDKIPNQGYNGKNFGDIDLFLLCALICLWGLCEILT